MEVSNARRSENIKVLRALPRDFRALRIVLVLHPAENNFVLGSALRAADMNPRLQLATQEALYPPFRFFPMVLQPTTDPRWGIPLTNCDHALWLHAWVGSGGGKTTC